MDDTHSTPSAILQAMSSITKLEVMMAISKLMTYERVPQEIQRKMLLLRLSPL